MKTVIYCFVLSLMLTAFRQVQAVTIADSVGEFSLDYQPKRIVVLEYSFVDILSAINVSPIGIADDNDPLSILPYIQNKLLPWQSVGLRSQPSLERIASLHPDLIIADSGRHSSVYKSLSKIAPTLLLPSRRSSYESNLKTARIIGKAIGKQAQMEKRLAVHQAVMMNYRNQIEQAGLSHKVIQFGIARENSFYAHSGDSYTGGVIHALTLNTSNVIRNESGSRQINLEQLLSVNPDYLIIGDYASDQRTIIGQWQKLPLWSLLKAVNNRHILHVDGASWVQYRGIIAAEHMAKDLVDLMIADATRPNAQSYPAYQP